MRTRTLRRALATVAWWPVIALSASTRADDAGVDAGVDAGGDAASDASFPIDATTSDADADDTSAEAEAPLPPCFDPVARPNPIHVAGGETHFISALAKLLAADTTPESIVNGPGPSCIALSDLLTRTKRTGTATYFDASGNGVTCALDPGGNEVDVAFSDSFASTCGIDVGTELGDFFGPITPQLFVVPVASSQMAISADAAYDAFGVNDGRSTPWIDPNFFAVRDDASGTQQVIASFIGVPADQWWGQAPIGRAQVIAKLEAFTTAADAEKAIGTLTTEDAQAAANYPLLRILAFQARGQSAAFWPDSSVRARDKANVRDGHYAMWGPLHLFAHLVGGAPAITAAPLVTRFTQVALDKSVLDDEIDNFYVPQCAMRVRRTTEGGPLSAYAPFPSCGCYFDARANSATTCPACSTDADCSADAPKCNYGFCEAR